MPTEGVKLSGIHFDECGLRMDVALENPCNTGTEGAKQ